MNKHRIMPLIFAFSFALFAPLLALGGTAENAHPSQSAFSRLLDKVDRDAEAAWTKWHEKNQTYVELVSLDQR